MITPHVYDEFSVSLCFQIRYVWKTKFTLANTLFIGARYPALLTAILVLLPVRFPQITPAHILISLKVGVLCGDE